MNWIKIVCNILDNRKIRMIRKGPEGNTLVLLWLLMLIEGGKCNRGGYLMVSGRVPYTAETLSLLTDISLQVVSLGLSIFRGFDMIDDSDGVIYIKNWSKYQSEDKLELRREKDRQRKQLQRQRERDKIAIPQIADMSRDGHTDASTDVTIETREDFEEKTTDIDVKLLLSGTPFSKISHGEFEDLIRRHGPEKLTLAADVAAETWRKKPSEVSNPVGYLNTLCTSLMIPGWYTPQLERMSIAELAATNKRMAAAQKEELEKAQLEQQEQVNKLWDSLPTEKQLQFIDEVKASIPAEINFPESGIVASAKSMAWEVSTKEGLK